MSFDTEARVLRLPKQEFIGTESVETLSPIVIDLKKLFEEGDQTQNIMLQDGDVLMVAAKKGTPFDAASAAQESETQQFYVVGSVVKPGIYPYRPDDTILMRFSGPEGLRNLHRVIIRSSVSLTVRPEPFRSR